MRIMSAPEGLVIPTGNVLLSVENTDPKCAALTSAVESILLKVWYPTTVATVSYHVREMFRKYAEQCCDEEELNGINFMLHDFGYRGVSSEESAAIGASAHLLNFMGTDTIPGMFYARDKYGADFASLAFSVAASQHEIMTSEGREGEIDRARRIIANHPNQIVSLVADSYDYYNFVQKMCKEQELVDRYKVRLVIRPDSTTDKHKTPEELVLWTLNYLANNLRGIKRNSKGFYILPYGVLWGDGIDPTGIDRILKTAVENNFSISNLVFGMGAGLLQKVNRDTLRFAFKCSAMKRDGVWHDIMKDPLDKSKRSKAGRMRLVCENGIYDTRALGEDEPNILLPTFENGVILNQDLWSTVRGRA